MKKYLLECLKRINERDYLTEREHREFYKVVKTALKRLESLDQLQEELGCPFEVVFKAFKNGIYVYDYTANKEKLTLVEVLFIDGRGIYFDLSGYFPEWINSQKLSDYKKTWWLDESKER